MLSLMVSVAAAWSSPVWNDSALNCVAVPVQVVPLCVPPLKLDRSVGKPVIVTVPSTSELSTPVTEAPRVIVTVLVGVLSFAEPEVEPPNTGGSDTALDAYGTAQRRRAEQVLKLTGRLTRIATLPQPLRPIRNSGMRLAARVPAVRQQLALQLSGLSHR